MQASQVSIAIESVTREGRKHRTGTNGVKINEDLAGSFDLLLRTPPPPPTSASDSQVSGQVSPEKERITLTAWFVADGHGEKGPWSPPRDYVSAGTAYVRLLARMVPSVLQTLLDPLPVLPGDSDFAKRMVERLQPFREALNAACMDYDAEICRENGSTLCLAFIVGLHLFCYTIGDSSMVIASESGEALKIWRRVNPTTNRSGTNEKNSKREDEAEGDEEEPAICSCEDSIDGFPLQLREGQHLGSVCRNFQWLYERKFLHAVNETTTTELAGSTRISPNDEHFARLQKQYPTLRQGKKRYFLLTAPTSNYGLRMFNCLGNTTHLKSMFPSINMYHFKLDALLKSHPSKNVNDKGIYLVMVTDGVKEVLTACEIAQLAVGKDIPGKFQKYLSSDHLPAPVPGGPQAISTDEFHRTLVLLAEKQKPWRLKCGLSREVTDDLLRAYKEAQGERMASETENASSLSMPETVLAETEMAHPVLAQPITFTSASTLTDPVLKLGATSVIAAACFKDTADDVTAVIARITVSDTRTAPSSSALLASRSTSASVPSTLLEPSFEDSENEVLDQLSTSFSITASSPHGRNTEKANLSVAIPKVADRTSSVPSQSPQKRKRDSAEDVHERG